MTAFQNFHVFVSYAHADDEIPVGTSATVGWVTALARNLNIGPNVYRKKLFIDHQLKPGDEFSSDLIAKVESSALLVLLLSQNYIDSDWCGKELESFIRAHANDPEKPADVFVVELVPFEAFTSVPENIQNVRKRLIHAKFWHQPANAASPVLSGYPTPKESGSDGEVHYWRVLNELRAAVDSRLRTLAAIPSPASTVFSGARPAVTGAIPAVLEPPEAELGPVLLADVTDDLEAERNSVKVALQAEGIAVLPDGDYVGLTREEFDAAFSSDLSQAALFVQLLSPTAGRRAKGFPAPLPQLQFERASASRLPVIQWCQRLPQPGQVIDAGHARLFETEFLRATNLATFKSEVIGRLRAEKENRRKRDMPSPPAGKRLVFMDDVASEPGLSNKLRAIIRGSNYDIRSLPPKAPLGSDGIDIKELLKPCRAGITIYADRGKYATVYNRLVFFLNQVAEAGLPLARWGVYIEQDTVASAFGIESDDVVPVNEQNLADFLRGL